MSQGLSLPHVYRFTGTSWSLRILQTAADDGILNHTSAIDLSCKSGRWRAPKYNCRLHLLERASGIPAREQHGPCCGTLNLFYSDDDGERKGELVAELAIAPDRFALVQRMLISPRVRIFLSLEFSEDLKGWDGERQVYCDRYTIEFQPDESEQSE